MAKTIYDYWFVQFDFPDKNKKPYKSSDGEMIYTDGHIIPKSWRICKIQDIISSICTGLNPRDNFSLGSGNIKYITVKNLTLNGTLDFTGCDTIDESARTIFITDQIYKLEISCLQVLLHWDVVILFKQNQQIGISMNPYSQFVQTLMLLHRHFYICTL